MLVEGGALYRAFEDCAQVRARVEEFLRERRGVSEGAI